MVPAASATRAVNGGTNGPKAASSGAEAGAGGESFEKTLKRVGDERESKKVDAPAEASARAEDENPEAIALEPEQTEETATPRKSKPTKETKPRRAMAQNAGIAESQPPLPQPLEQPTDLLEVVVSDEFSPRVPAIDLEPQTHVGAVAEALVEACAREIEAPDAPALEAEWSVQTPPIVVEEIIDEVVESAGMDPREAFTADAQVGLIELDQQVFEPVQEAPRQIAAEPVQMIAPEPDAEPDVESVFASSGDKGVREDVREDVGEVAEPMEGFAKWVEETVWELTEDETGAASVVRHEMPGVAASAGGVAPDALESHPKPAGAADKPAMPAEVRFSHDNHPRIVSAVRSEIVGPGGTMQIQLDPPELGALAVKIEMRDGVMTASFATSNDEATRLLSHSLSQLKNTLESQGINVEKIQVQQAPREESSSRGGDDGGRQEQGGQSEREAKQDQERREMLQRMWRRIAVGSDPVDLTA